MENEICELTNDILFIYSKKEKEKELLHDLVDRWAAELDHKQEAMIEDAIKQCNYESKNRLLG